MMNPITPPITPFEGVASFTDPKSVPKRFPNSSLTSLDVSMAALDVIDRKGPLTATVTSPFLDSPVIGSTLLTSAAKVAKNAAPPLMTPITPLVMHPIHIHHITSKGHSKEAVTVQNQVLFEGQIRPVAVAAFEDLLFLMRIAKWKVAYQQGQPFNRQEQLPYFGRVDEALVRETLDKTISEIWPHVDGRPDVPEAERARILADIIVSPTSPLGEVVGALRKAFELFCKAIERFGATSYTSLDSSDNAQSSFELTVKHRPDRLIIEWPSSAGETLLAAVTERAQALRDAEADPTFVDFLVFHVGYELLRSGAKIDSKDARWLGTPGFRKDTQTFVSLTDPGDGHVFGTTRRARWLKGAICHVEHLERPGNLPREEIESYRIPSIFEFARVRLHTGSAAPNTYFVGRRVKDSVSGSFANDFIKVVNLTSAACSAAFQLGAAEAKVAMDGLTASEQIAYMRALSGHVLRNHKQVLSAAYNLNSPLIDDLAKPEGDSEECPIITDNIAIAKRGIELAALGGFDKVTFDGAADSYPSHCVILQVTFQNALELVHLAHQAGLTTYMSAGFKFAHIADAVYSGVDGIGIGGAQILRYMDGSTGHHGPYTEEFIDRIDNERDDAANSVRGRGAHLLARLDRMFYEGSISSDEDALRQGLFQALWDMDEPAIESFLSHAALASIIAMPNDGECPTLGNARRLLRKTTQPLLLSKTQVASLNTWNKLLHDLSSLVKQGDEETMAQYYRSQPWTALREEYAKTLKTARGDRMYTIKTAPHAPMSI